MKSNNNCTVQDLVVPAFKMPGSYRSSPLLGAPLHQRTTLLYFRGDMGVHRMPWYSRCVVVYRMPNFA